MKRVMVPVELETSTLTLFDTALAAARRLGGSIEGIGCIPDWPTFVSEMGVSWAMLEVQEPSRELARYHKLFEDYFGPRAAQEREAGPFTFVSSTKHPSRDTEIGWMARAYDLTVVARPGRDGKPRGALLESILFDSGRPILVAPPEAPGAFGEHVLIAWNASSETARTVAFAMPFLKLARKVVVLTVEGGTIDGPPGAELARTLRQNEVPAEPVTIRPTGSTGESILAYAKSSGADFLVKGAYTQSRIRQLIFGGATRHILDNATLPVFMAH
jgi:nucleotide-binding universal stress UspA family protein